MTAAHRALCTFGSMAGAYGMPVKSTSRARESAKSSPSETLPRQTASRQAPRWGSRATAASKAARQGLRPAAELGWGGGWGFTMPRRRKHRQGECSQQQQQKHKHKQGTHKKQQGSIEAERNKPPCISTERALKCRFKKNGYTAPVLHCWPGSSQDNLEGSKGVCNVTAAHLKLYYKSL
jgi:hypothetical protein